MNLPVDYTQGNVCVVIPTLNEEATLLSVIVGVRPYCSEILVVDGGSTDGTLEIARAANVRIEALDMRGKGLALRHALQTVKETINSAGSKEILLQR